MNLSTPIGRLRLAGIFEGISCIALFLVAMPMKYIGNMPHAVKYPGWVHGVLFILFLLALLQVWVVRKWPFRKVLIGFAAALVPFGTFVFDRQLVKEQ